MTSAPHRTRVHELIEELGLMPHPEGGYFREVFRDATRLTLPARFSGPRSASTAIYYLLESGDFSAFHRIASDEVWHHYEGSPLTVHVLREGHHTALLLGKELTRGERPLAVVPAGAWFGSRVEADGEYVLVGCTVAPGFDFVDFELASRAALTTQYPEHARLIATLTRDP